MEYFLNPDVIEYVCCCGMLSPLTKLYFCRHCLQLRCGFCVHHEVSQFSKFILFFSHQNVFIR